MNFHTKYQMCKTNSQVIDSQTSTFYLLYISHVKILTISSLYFLKVSFINPVILIWFRSELTSHSHTWRSVWRGEPIWKYVQIQQWLQGSAVHILLATWLFINNNFTDQTALFVCFLVARVNESACSLFHWDLQQFQGHTGSYLIPLQTHRDTAGCTPPSRQIH